MTVGQGPVNRLIKLFVFGDLEDDEVSKMEEGMAPASPPSPPPQEPSTLQYYGRLLLCIVGLQGAYLTWGVLQVRVMC